VLYSLLKSPLQFEITSISIARPDRLDRGSPAKKAWAARIQPGQTAAPKLALAPKPTPARPTTPAPTAALPFGGGAPPPGFGPSAEEINRMIEEQRAAAEAAAKEQEKIMMEAMNRARGMTNAPGTMPGATAPSSAARRMRSALTTKGTTVTEDIKAQLPKTLVDLTIRGYVADYKEKKTTN